MNKDTFILLVLITFRLKILKEMYKRTILEWKY